MSEDTENTATGIRARFDRACAMLGWDGLNPENYLVSDAASGNIVFRHASSDIPKLNFRGKGNTVIIGANVRGPLDFEMRRSSVIGLGDDVNVRRYLRIVMTNRQNLTAIGRGCEIVGMAVMVGEYGLSVRIGQDCLISTDVTVRATDSHPIFDRTTGQRINLAAPVVLEDRVWLAQAVAIAKGTRIGTGSMIGLGSFVRGDVEPHCVYAGSPARKLRDNIHWEKSIKVRELPPELRVPPPE